jgi:hypothetical protein
VHEAAVEAFLQSRDGSLWPKADFDRMPALREALYEIFCTAQIKSSYASFL